MSVQDSPSEAEIVTPAKKSKRGGNFSVEEDKLLVLAWLNTSVDAVHHGGNNDQNNKAPFYTKIAKYFHDHKKDSTRTVIDAKDLFKEIYNCNFQFEHCWLLLKNLPKWTLNKPRENLRKELPQTPDSIEQDQAGRDDVLLDDTMDFRRPIGRKVEKPN
uniref:No apical meristem-associated C-terminal domain-containing protein n=1 Tax=Quercus lobata TaxID=97700 RepID=A0A7N2LC65_QUELO